ncbi:MAG: TonB-dependent receptor, partial [Acidobacteria bacterium]
TVQSTVNPTAPPGILFAGDPGVPRGIAQTRKDHFSPRIGLAWDVTGDGKTSVRAGAGVFYGSLSGNQWNTTANFEPFAIRLTFPNGGNAATGATLANPYRGYPGGIPFPYNGSFVAGGSIYGADRSFEWPYTYQLNLSLQRQLTKDLSIMTAYVGSLSHNLPFATDINYPFMTPTASTAPANVQARRPDQSFGSILLMRSNQTAQYHGFQLSAVKRMGHHFSLNGFYTYSKTLESVQLQNNTTQGGVQNMRNLKLDRGRTDDDMRHQFVMSGLWDISYYSGGNAIAKWILNGWNIDPIVQVHSGLPFTVTNGADINLDGVNNDRAVLLPGANPHLANPTAAMWFNTTAFGVNGSRIAAVTGSPLEGNTSRDFLNGPGLVQVDMAISKKISLRERFGFEFRAEALNVFNHANLNNPNATVPASIAAPGNYGQITGAQTTRVLQLGLRLTF